MKALFRIGFFFLFTACANVIPPSGGPVDLEGPKIKSFSVDSATSNQKAIRVVIQFDELVELKPSSKINYFPGCIQPNRIKVRKDIVQLDFDTSFNLPGMIDWNDAIQDVNHQNSTKTSFLLIDPEKTISSDSLNVLPTSLFDVVDAYPFWIEVVDSSGCIWRKKKIESKSTIVFYHLSYRGKSIRVMKNENEKRFIKTFAVSFNQTEIQVGIPMGDEKVYGADSLLDAKVFLEMEQKSDMKTSILPNIFEFREGRWFSVRAMENGFFPLVSGKVTLAYYSNDELKVRSCEIKKGLNQLKLNEFLSPSSVKQ